MALVVYLDLLILINFAFNLILVTISGWMGLQRFRLGRYCLAALAGAIFWLIFFFYPQYIFIDWFCRIAGGLAVAYIAWRPGNIRALVSKTVLLVVAGQLMGGGIYSLAFALDSSPLGRWAPALPLTVVASGGVLMLAVAAWWAGRLHTARQLKSYIAEARIYFQGKLVTVQALLDSGNTLRHPVNSWPVLILERQAARSILTDELIDWLDFPQDVPPLGMETRIGLVPFKSVGGSGILGAVRPDRLELRCERGSAVLTEVYISLRLKHQKPLEHQALAFPVENWKEGDIG